jgi:hypothetical protein
VLLLLSLLLLYIFVRSLTSQIIRVLLHW